MKVNKDDNEVPWNWLCILQDTVYRNTVEWRKTLHSEIQKSNNQHIIWPLAAINELYFRRFELFGVWISTHIEQDKPTVPFHYSAARWEKGRCDRVNPLIFNWDKDRTFQWLIEHIEDIF